LFSQGGDTGEDTFDMLLELVEGNVVDLVIVDSVAALTPRSDLEAEMGGGQPGAHARLMSQGLRKLTRLLTRGHKTTVVFINQTRSKIGGYGNPETTTGGNALKFYASVRLRISNAGEIKAGGEKGIRSKIKARKTKLAVPYGECFVDITGGNGVTTCYAVNARSKGDPTKDNDDDDD
jgi:recombination protein RecA